MYINPNIFKVDWDDLTGWTDCDNYGGVSEIDPAGQLHLDLTGVTGQYYGYGSRYKDLGSL